MRTRLLPVLLLVLLGSCGADPAAAIDVPDWAHVAPEQIAEAQKLGVPVVFENELGMRFVLIPAGTFRMGSPTREQDRGDDESPHEVTITEPYYASIHEVTSGSFRAYRPDHPAFVLGPSAGDAGDAPQADRLPMVDVSWGEAAGFAKWLDERSPTRAYRLPTEAEWEYACRAGTTTRFWWGDEAVGDAARYDSEAAYVRGRVGPAEVGTTAVGSFPPNPWGLYDTPGNVLEWCADWYAPYPQGAVSDPRGPDLLHAPSVTVWVRTGEDARMGSGKARVQRGGGWNQLPRFCRSAARLRAMPEDRQDYYGFRLVSPLPAPTK